MAMVTVMILVDTTICCQESVHLCHFKCFISGEDSLRAKLNIDTILFTTTTLYTENLFQNVTIPTCSALYKLDKLLLAHDPPWSFGI